MTDKTGGPAFPKTGSFSADQSACYDSANQDGMSLRDYFAAKAMQSLLMLNRNEEYSAFIEIIGRVSYAYADAMLAERAK